MSFGLMGSYVALWALVLFQGLLVLALLRQVEQVRRLIERGGSPVSQRLPIGSEAPPFTGPDIRTRRLIDSRLPNGKKRVILFLSADCSVCRDLVVSLRHPIILAATELLIVCHGKEAPCSRLLARLDPEIPALLDEGITGRYRVSTFPTAVSIDATNTVQSYNHPENLAHLAQLLGRDIGGGPSAIPDEESLASS